MREICKNVILSDYSICINTFGIAVKHQGWWLTFPFTDGMSTADLMQPGLVPLQPNLDDLMDYDSIQGRQLFYAHSRSYISKLGSEIPKILYLLYVFIFNCNGPCFHLSDIVTTRSQGNSVMYFTGNQSMDTSTNTTVRKLCIIFRANVICEIYLLYPHY